MAIHPQAIVDPQAKIAASAEVGPFAVIEGPVKIGEHAKIYPNTYISGWTEIGDRCEIHPNAIVGHLPQDFHFEGGRSYCRIGAGTIIREGASIHRGTQAESTTVVGKDCFILGNAHVGHNCEVGDDVKIYNCAVLSGHVTVGDHAIISGYVLVHQFCRIGEYVMVGGGARLTKDVPPYMKALHESTCVGYNVLGLQRSGEFTSEETGEIRTAFRMMFRTRAPFLRALDEFATQVRTRTGRRIVDFCKSESKLGIIGGRRANAVLRDAAENDYA